jgi:XRE family transcriptional regulator
MIDNPELGYTPNNLKAVRQKHGLTQQAAADLLDVTISAIQRWESDVNLKSHTDMPIKKWFEFLQKLTQ